MSRLEPKFHSVEKRFVQALVMLVAIIQAISVSFQLLQSSKSYDENLKTNSELSMGLLSKVLEVPLGEFNIPEVQRIVNETVKEESIEFISVFDSSGAKLIGTGDGAGQNLLRVHQDILSSARGGEKVGGLEIGVRRDGVDSAFRKQLLSSLFGAVLLGIAVTLMMRFLFRHFVSRPLAKLNKFAVEKANTDHLLGQHRNDEFGNLSKVLLEMALEIKDNTQNLERMVRQRTEALEASNQSLTQTVDQLKTTQEQLINNSKLAALGKMAAGIAHEINNPLSVLKGNATMLRMGDPNKVEDVEKFQKRVTTITRMVDRIATIINGMRSFSRSDTGDEPFLKTKLVALIHESTELAQIRFRSSNVRLEVGDVLDIELECRSIQVSQVIINLLSNAYDAVCTKPESWVRVSTQLVDGNIEIEVKDSGLGIPEEIANKLMQPFFTTKEAGAGTGLGLSISLGIAKAHHGSFKLDRSCPNTRFVLSLPIHQPETDSQKTG